MQSDAYLHGINQALYTHAKEFVGVYDPSLGWFSQVNDAGVKLMGYDSEEAFLADPNHTFRIPPWTPDQWRKLCDLTRLDGHQEVDVPIRHFTGHSFQGHVVFSYFEVEEKPLFLIRLADHDHLQRVERELSDSQRRFEAIFTNATIGIVVCDQSGAIVQVNRKVETLFGHASEELVGELVEILTPSTSRQQHAGLRSGFQAEPRARVMGKGSVISGQRKDGTLFPVEITLSHFYLDIDFYTVAYIRDISLSIAADKEITAKQQQVTRLQIELEKKISGRTDALHIALELLETRSKELSSSLASEREASEVKSRSVSIASHEFRSPLAVILTSVDLIEEYVTYAGQANRLKHIQRIRSSVKHLTNILDEFLSVGRIEEGKYEALLTPFLMTELVAEILTDLDGQLKDGPAIVQQIDCPDRLVLDSSLLRKILMNLLSNAIKYSDKKTEIVIRASCANGRVIVEVKDGGIGISPEDQTQLFKPFFRASNVAGINGNGLGLYIVSKYLEIMKGTILLHSEPQVGTTITITIPYANHLID